MTIQLKGERLTGRIWLFGNELFPDNSHIIRKHSDSFSWGYNGSGPAQLALAICLELFDRKYAEKIYQDFKFWYIGALPQSDFEIDIQIQPLLFEKYPLTTPNSRIN